MPRAKQGCRAAGAAPVTPRVRGDRIRGCGWRQGLSRLAAAAVLAAAPAAGRAAAILHLRCTNPASGANWRIAVDLDRGRVDALPAAISGEWISWHDPNRGFFDLERATGKLQLRNASSTGGYFLYYLCRPE